MKKRQIILKLLFGIFMGFFAFTASAQNPTDDDPLDPGSIVVSKVQNMNFGVFFQGQSGGTAIVSNSGVRTFTGSVVGLNIGPSPFHSIFDVEGPQGTIVSIMRGPTATLVGSNGGTMSLSLGNTSPGSPFVITVPPPGRTSVHIGGTLNVGSPTVSPPGNYTGVFYVTFNQE